MFILILLFLLLSFTPARADALSTPAISLTPRTLAESYLHAVLEDDWREARSYWSAADLAAANRLDVNYVGQPFKLDSASPIVLERDRIRGGEIDVSVGEVVQKDSSAQIHFTLRAGDATATATYCAIVTEGSWRLTDSTTFVAGDWPRKSTEFLDLHVQPTMIMPEEAVRTLDRFVAGTCARLEVSADRLEFLRARKLAYYLCDESTVTEIVGTATQGAALLQTDAVVTSEPCHLHELAHLLVNFALRDIPLYTMPFLQEGAAVTLGGRWGRAPEVMQGLGKYSLHSGLIAVDDLLTWHEFRDQAADWTYAPSGVFAGFLLETLGGGGFLDLYRRLSGDQADLESLDRATVQERICAATRTDWASLQSRLADHMDRLSCGGILPDDDLVGEDIQRPEEFARLEGEDLVVTISSDDRWIHWQVASEGSPWEFAVLLEDPGSEPLPAGGIGAGATGAGGTGAGAIAGGGRLFAEQFPQRPYAGEWMAIVVRSGEIGVYDFRTGLLVAKFVEDFCPGRTLGTAEGASLRFKTSRHLFPARPWHVSLVRNP